MTINWWTLGLQAVNVLVLVWLLSRVFWRPVAKAIATRQEAAQTLLADAKTAKSETESALAEITKSRAEMSMEREKLLADANKEAANAAKVTLAEAAKKAESVLKAAQKKRGNDDAVASAKTVSDSVDLAVDIARKLLSRIDPIAAEPLFLDFLISAIDEMPEKDREALVKTAGGIDLVSAAKLDVATKTKITKAVSKSLGNTKKLNFQIDPDLIVGLELRSPHFVLSNSWQADLKQIRKAMNDAA